MDQKYAALPTTPSLPVMMQTLTRNIHPLTVVKNSTALKKHVNEASYVNPADSDHGNTTDGSSYDESVLEYNEETVTPPDTWR